MTTTTNCTPRLEPLGRFLSLVRLGEESVLFSEKSGNLYGLDRIATGIALRLGSGEAPEVLKREFGSPGLASTMDALSDLIAGREFAAQEYRTELPCPLEAPAAPADLPRYRLLDVSFTVQAPESISGLVAPVLERLRSGGNAAIALRIEMEPEGPGWRLLFNNALQGEVLPEEEVLPILYARLCRFAYQTRPYLLALHGAVLEKDGRTLILAGSSGSGKSTLAAVLAARGYAVVSDEPAVIDSEGSVLPMPLGLGLKQGSWAAVAPDYPALAGLPVHRRFDGLLLRYLAGDSVRLHPLDKRLRPTHIVFPKYDSAVQSRLEELSPVQTMAAIVEQGYQVTGLDAEKAAAILSLICGMERFAMTYSSTPGAIDLIRQITERSA
jgi:hypothetical protein